MKYSKATVEKLLRSPKKKELPDSIEFYYGGWSLLELREMCPDMFYDQSWHNNEEFAKVKSKAGMYTVQLKVPNSNSKTFEEQKALAEHAPVAVAATAMILLLKEKIGKDPLDGDWTRCIEQASLGDRVALSVSGGRVRVSGSWDDSRDDSLWSSCGRTS